MTRFFRTIKPFFYLLPSLVILGLFAYYPAFSVFRLSLFKWEFISPKMEFVGFDQFVRLFGDDRFWNSLWVTAKYTVGVTAVSLFLGLILAVLLNQKKHIPGRSVWRSIYFLPSVTPTVAIAMVWMLIFNPGFGIVNIALRKLGMEGLNWLADMRWALFCVMLLGIWRRMGFNFLNYLAALQNVSESLYESAEIDGANGFEKFLYITLPMVKPTTIMLLILGVIDSFMVIDQILILTGGGPGGSTEVIGQFMYTTAFRLAKLGYGSAISVVMFLIIMIFTVFQWRFVGFGTAEE